jgi:hypothetical protein
MRAELDHVPVGRGRWRFSLGCAWAAMLIRTRSTLGSHERGGEGLRLVIFTGIAGAVALVGYGLLYYPGLLSGFRAWASIAAFLAVLFVYAAVTLALSRGASTLVAASRRYGLAGGLAVGGSWLIALSPPPSLREWVLLPLTAALLGPACVAAVASRQHARTGTLAALWSGIVGGLGVFIAWVTTTYLHHGGPYDPGLVSDFHRSGAPDLATYAVSDNLGTGMVLLLLIPTVALALGSLTARRAANPPT